MALVRMIVSGEANPRADDRGRSVSQARDIVATAEELLVDGDWKVVESSRELSRSTARGQMATAIKPASTSGQRSR